MTHRLARFTAEVSHPEHTLSAVRMALGIAVPTGALILLGSTDLVMYAAFGAFTGMYGRAVARRVRVRHQACAGAVLVAGVVLGTVLSQGRPPASVLVLSEAAFAAAASVFADGIGFRPVGPFFGLFAFGACVAFPPAGGRVPAAAAASLGAAIFALALGVVLPAKTAPADAAGNVGRDRTSPSCASRAAEYALAIILAGFCALALGIGHPHWAMASAAVPLAAEGLSGRLGRAMHRIGGTLAGLGLSALILAADPTPRTMAELVVGLQFPTELFIARHYGLALFFFTPLILLMTQLALPIPADALIRDRAVETVVGVLTGIAVVLVTQGGIRLPAPRR